MKKKIIRMLALTMGIIMCLSFSVYAQTGIKVYIDNKVVAFDVQPQIIDGRTMVPMRAIFERLGATVEWDEYTRTITAYNDDYYIVSAIGDKTMVVNHEEKRMDIAPLIIDGRTLVPIRFVAEAFDCDVEWNGNRRAVYITTAKVNTDYDSSLTSNSNSYYSGTTIPTFTSVTGVELDRIETLDDGEFVYVYNYTNADDVGDYWRELVSLGWVNLSGDDETTNRIFESAYYKNGDYIIVDVMLALDEVWILIG